MADPKAPSRAQISRWVGNDPELIRLVERLFQVAGDETPTELDGLALGLPVDVFGALESLRADMAQYAELLKIAHESNSVADITQISADVSRLSDEVGGLLLAPAPRERSATRYGQFYDTTTQTAAVVNTAYAVTLNTTSVTQGVYLSGSQIVVDTPGVYNFQTSVQLDKTSGGVGRFHLWFAKNGTAIADSASTVRIQGNDAEVFSAVNLFIPLAAGDYVELMWAVDDTSVQLQSFAAAAPVPGVPSVILTVSDNMENAK